MVSFQKLTNSNCFILHIHIIIYKLFTYVAPLNIQQNSLVFNVVAIAAITNHTTPCQVDDVFGEAAQRTY